MSSLRSLPIYQVDAFTGQRFAGNPAAVCPLETWLPEATMQAIAAENNLSETAFFVPTDEGYAIRWFTPTAEVDLCGHATLATAYVILTELDPDAAAVQLSCAAHGQLQVSRADDRLYLDFPALPASPREPSAALSRALGAPPTELLGGPDRLLAVFSSQAQVAALQPDMAALRRVEHGKVIASAPGDEEDFVSRFFAPAVGIDEDPVTGAAHCTLVPYWSKRLGKKDLTARQISPRGGELHCVDEGGRVRLGGQAVLYLRGTILL